MTLKNLTCGIKFCASMFLNLLETATFEGI